MSIKSTIQEKQKTTNYPQLRRGVITGKIYFFPSPGERGVCLQGGTGVTTLSGTEAFSGSITLENE